MPVAEPRPLTEAQRRLALDNRGIAWAVLRRFTLPAGLDPDDAAQEAVYGLLRAAQGFRPERGFKFSTYAWWCAFRRLQKAAGDTLGRPETQLGVPEDVPDPVSEDDGPAEGVRAAAELVARLLIGLHPRDRRAVELIYGLDGQPPRSLDETGRHLGVSKERVRQLVKRALARMRAAAAAA